jgi:hypothetical protein
MGADLILAMLPMRKTQDEAIAKLKSLTQDDVLHTLANYCAMEFGNESDEAEYAEAIEWLTGKVAEVYGYYERGSRETEVRTIDGTDWLITGGMSWGDDPTDAYEAVSTVSIFRLTYDEILTDHLSTEEA